MSDNATIKGIEAELQFTANKQSINNVAKSVSQNVAEQMRKSTDKAFQEVGKNVGKTIGKSIKGQLNEKYTGKLLSQYKEKGYYQGFKRTYKEGDYEDWWAKALAKKNAKIKANITKNLAKLNEVKAGSFTSVRTDDFINNSLGIGQKGFYTQEMVDQMFQSPLTKIASAFDKVKEAIKGALKPLKVFLGRIGRIAIYRAIRSALKSIASAFKEGKDNLYQWSKLQKDGFGNEFAKSLDRISTAFLTIKNSIGAITAPIITALTPAIENLALGFQRLSESLSQFFATILGTGYYYKAISSNIKYADSIKAIKNQLMGFDELNVMDNNSSSTTPNYGSLFEKVTLDNTLEKAISEKMVRIGAIVGGSMLALGAILTFTGANIPIGISLMASGAALYGKTIKENWDAMPNELKRTIGIISGLVAAASLALGVVLLCTGTPKGIAIGLGLIGASLAGIAVAVDWNALKDKVMKVWDSIKIWFKQNVAPFFTVDYWKQFGVNIVRGIKEGISVALSGDESAIRNILNKLTGGLFFGESTYNYSGTSQDYRLLHARANGGSVPTGDLFIAGESGAELVTHLGGQNMVYNEQQLGNSLVYANEGVVNAINTLIGVVKSKSNNVTISANDIRKAVNTSNMRLGV